MGGQHNGVPQFWQPAYHLHFSWQINSAAAAAAAAVKSIVYRTQKQRMDFEHTRQEVRQLLCKVK